MLAVEGGGWVVAAGAPCPPAPDEAAGDNTPARHADTAPAATTTTMPSATQRPRPREPLASAAARTSPAARPPGRAEPSHSLPISVPSASGYGGGPQRRGSSGWHSSALSIAC